MITCKLSGSLAAQLFQIFTVICYARQNNDTFFFILSNFLKDGNPTYWDSLLQRIAMYNQLPHSNNLATIVIKEQNTVRIPKLSPLVKRSNVVVEMHGQFKNYKYFVTEMDSIHKLIDLQGQAQRKGFAKYDVGVWNDIPLDPSFVEKSLAALDNPTNVLYYSSDEDLLQFSQCCTHHIISGTALGFWSAFLDPSTSKRVFYDAASSELVYPPEWTKIT